MLILIHENIVTWNLHVLQNIKAIFCIIHKNAGKYLHIYTKEFQKHFKQKGHIKLHSRITIESNQICSWPCEK